MRSGNASAGHSAARRILLLMVTVIVAAAVILLVGRFIQRPPDNQGGDYWMYVGSRWSRSVKGVYLFKYHSTSGKVEYAGVASGWLWQANIDSLKGSAGRVAAQIRAGWPNPMKMLLGEQNPSVYALHPNGRYLYAADLSHAGSILAYQADAVTGKLTVLNIKSSGGAMPTFITVDNTGKNLLVADYEGAVGVLPIDSDGRLHDAASVIHPKGSDPSEKRQSHPHCVTMSPDNRFAIVADYGLDELLVYRFDPEHASLTPNDPASVKLPETAAPRHLTFHSGGELAYAVGETGSCITVLRWDNARGAFTVLETVSTLPNDFHGPNAASEVLVHPNGRFLYSANRGHDSLVAFTIDASTGALTAVQYAPAGGRRPVNILFDPTGNYLFAENNDSDNVVQFRIDQQTGQLTPAASFGAPAPVCLRFLPARQPE